MTEQALKDLLDSMTLEEKAGQLVQCNAGQFVANELEITGPDGEPLPTEELARVIGSVLTFENAEQAKTLKKYFEDMKNAGVEGIDIGLSGGYDSRLP